MCEVYSAIFTSDYYVLDHPSSDSHEDIIALYKLVDDKIGPAREWLRVEVRPHVSLTSKYRKDWCFFLDERQDGGLPSWYSKSLGEAVVVDHLLRQVAKGRYKGRWRGDLNLFGAKIKSLPKGLVVDGDVDLRHSSIERLPKGFKVGGFLDLRGTEIKSLPEGLEVSGFLDLAHSSVINFPKMLKVGNYLDLRNVPARRLSEKLEVGGDLDLGDSAVMELPENLRVGGHLNLQRTDISQLPKFLFVGKDIYLYGSAVKEIPNSVEVGGAVYGRGVVVKGAENGKA